MKNVNDSAEVKRQYAEDGNLNIRIRLHTLYSTNPQGWGNWVFENYSFAPGFRVLELGCGNAQIWRDRAQSVPEGVRLTLSDFSEGMLTSAKANTAALDFVDYSVIDAQSIPFEADLFDAVIANHMLYHVPNMQTALCEIARVLKPSGTFYATTLGINNMKELTDILQAFDANLPTPQTAVTEAFGLETGEAKLARHFRHIEVRRYPDSLLITEPQPLIDYVLSMHSLPDADRFARHIKALFAENPTLTIGKDAGMFISKLPSK